MGGEEICLRDVVLKLIRKMNFDVFVYVIVNGFFNVLFFIFWFKEVVYYYYVLFDMFDLMLLRDN